MADSQDMSIFNYIDDSSNLSSMRSSGNIILFRDMIKELIKDKFTLSITELMKKILKNYLKKKHQICRQTQ